MATLEELQEKLRGQGGVLLGDAQVETRHLRDGSVTEPKLAFAIATQAELDALAAGVPTNATFNDHNARHEPGGADPMAVDAAAGTGSLRTLGTGATQAAVGNHDHGSGLTLISGNSGAAPTAAAPWELWQFLTSDAAANSTTTIATVMTLTGLPSGTWYFEYHIIWQSAATTTGVKFRITAAGTVTRQRCVFIYPSTGTGAGGTTGISTGAQVLAAGSHVEHHSARGNGTPLNVGPTSGVDNANQDNTGLIRGILVTSTSGDLTLGHASEVAASSQVMADTVMFLKRLA